MVTIFILTIVGMLMTSDLGSSVSGLRRSSTPASHQYLRRTALAAIEWN